MTISRALRARRPAGGRNRGAPSLYQATPAALLRAIKADPEGLRKASPPHSLFPVTERAERDLISCRKFLLSKTE
jgi:hypothetical protein